jgi:hypothetical protein
MKNLSEKRGFIKLLIIIFIGIIVISYFGFDIRSIVESPQSQSNLGYVWGFLTNIWTTYLMQPVTYFWNNIFIDLLWNSFVANMEKIKNGEATDLELNTPYVNP